jgi:hypothetical protein
MNLSKREQKKMVLNILESKLKEWRVSAKLMLEDKNCDLQTYEKLVDNCTELEYTIQQMEKHYD